MVQSMLILHQGNSSLTSEDLKNNVFACFLTINFFRRVMEVFYATFYPEGFLNIKFSNLYFFMVFSSWQLLKIASLSLASLPAVMSPVLLFDFSAVTSLSCPFL